jgi:dUTP pyrophosphatase
MIDLQNDSELNDEIKRLFDEIKNFKDENDEDDDVMSEIESRLGLPFEEFEKLLGDVLTKKPLFYKKLTSDAVSPSYAYESDSGFDLYSTEEVVLNPFERKLVPTGLSFDIPEGYEIQVRTKSGLAIKQGLMVLNSPGTVDQGYTGEVKVILLNVSNEQQKIHKKMKIAQGVLCSVESGKKVSLVEDDFEDKDRGSNGFGSTGI